MSKFKTSTVYDTSHSTYITNIAQRIFMIIVTLYLLVDLTERLLGTRFASWIYATLFAGIALGLFMMAVSMLERSIMNKLNS